MSDFHDPDLRHQLGRLSGPYPDTNEAFAAWQRRVGQARRRRVMAITSGAAMSLIVAVVAIAALQGPRGRTVKQVDPADTSAPATTQVATSKPSTTESTAPSTTEATTTVAPETTPVTEPLIDTTTIETGTMPVGGSEQPPTATTHKGGSGGSPRTTQPSDSDPPQPDGLSKTISSDGGSITVRVDNGRLKLDNVDESDGYDSREGDGSSTMVEVTFTSDEHKYQITAWLWGGKIWDKVVDKSDHNSGESWGDGGGGGGGDGGDGDGD